VKPRAPRDEIAGCVAGALVVRLHAPPVEGAANRALLQFLARRLGVPVSAFEIVHGEKGVHKLIRVRGVAPERVRALAAEDSDAEA
jgi:uncharacterized protein (TIGR00251 family)